MHKIGRTCKYGAIVAILSAVTGQSHLLGLLLGGRSAVACLQACVTCLPIP